LDAEIEDLKDQSAVLGDYLTAADNNVFPYEKTEGICAYPDEHRNETDEGALKGGQCEDKCNGKPTCAAWGLEENASGTVHCFTFVNTASAAGDPQVHTGNFDLDQICNVKISKAKIQEAKDAIDIQIDEAYFKKQELADEKEALGEKYNKFQVDKKAYFDQKLADAKKLSDDEIAAYVKMIDDSNEGRK
jgi:hypothetical protein